MMSLDVLLSTLLVMVFGSDYRSVTASQTTLPSDQVSIRNAPGTITMKSEAGADLKGPLDRAELELYAYPWMKVGMREARAKLVKDSISVAAVAAALPSTEVEIYFGRWCSDSHDHLPAFLTLLDFANESGARPKSVRLVALDRKKTYEGYVNTRSIEKLPTFVFLRDGREIGRITETPQVSISADTAEILKK